MKCKICGAELKLTINGHYVTRDEARVGLANLVNKTEVKIYDTFDCQYCGCQNIMQERKRELELEELELEMNLPTSEEQKEREEQDCFGYYQEYIDKCRKCSEKERCKHNKESLQVKDTGLSKTNEKL